ISGTCEEGEEPEPGDELCDDTEHIFTTATGQTMLSTVDFTETGVIGSAAGEFTINSVSVDLQHTWAADMEIILISPAGTEVALTTDNGFLDGLDVRAILTFKDDSVNNVTDWNGGPPMADYRAEGGATTHPVAEGDGPGVDL